MFILRIVILAVAVVALGIAAVMLRRNEPVLGIPAIGFAMFGGLLAAVHAALDN